jgi:hypothetical protein
MKICKVRPDHSTCSACVATQVGTEFWSGDYAMVQKDGKITKVSLSRVYDVKESS